MKLRCRLFWMFLFLAFALRGYAGGYPGPASLADKGDGLLPKPQEASFSGEVSALGGDWTLVAENVPEGHIAVRSLLADLHTRFDLKLRPGETKQGSGVIRLVIRPGSVPVGKTVDTNRTAIKRQAYHLTLSAGEITIRANAGQGLFYGVQTLLQLLRLNAGRIFFPQGEITDWPALELRVIYWDDAHHLERFDELKRIIRQVARYKINGFALKLEGHFQYASARPVVEPYALTPDQYQELTDYAKERFIHLIPYLDAPGHAFFILKHPEYAALRAYPGVNYEFCVTQPGTYALLDGMFGDLIAANKGSKYIVLSTDEPYYIGKPDNAGCTEVQRAKALGGNGRLEAEFITKVSDKLYQSGRSTIFWGEFPLTSSDIRFLPAHLIDGVYHADMAPVMKQHGIRQLIYASTQGVEPLFPDYYPRPAGRSKGRVAGMLEQLSSAINNDNASFMGTIIAAWGDAGLHPETFWLGYAAGSAIAWNNQGLSAADLEARFFKSFYGPQAIEMDKVYALLCRQAQFWDDSWNRGPAKDEPPILGNSEGLFKQPQFREKYTLPLPPVPDADDLSVEDTAGDHREKRAQNARALLRENDRLLALLNKNLRTVNGQRYNLEVLLSIARLCRQNLDLLLGLKEIRTLLTLSAGVAGDNPSAALSAIDQALQEAHRIRRERNSVFQSVVTVWYQSWLPRVAQANGRRYLYKLDDIKDHLPVRTIDMSYLIYRELNYPLGTWARKVREARNQFAEKNNLPVRTGRLNWKNYHAVETALK